MKKKVIALTLVVFTLLSMFPVVASASELIELTSSIANIEMSDFYLDSDHTKPLGENAVTKDTEIFAGLSVAFNEDNQPASESTEYNYIFPAEINMTTVTNGILYDGAKPAGTYTIANGEVRFNFYDSWLKTNSSAIKTSLVTCTPYGINTHRLLVRGHRVSNLTDEEYSQEKEKNNSYLFIVFAVAIITVVIVLCVILLIRRKKKRGEKYVKNQNE